MNRHLRVSILLFEALLILFAAYFEPSCHVRGRLWGEAFFDGKPTSWWREELSRWEAHEIRFWRGSEGRTPFFYRTPTRLERWSYWHRETAVVFDAAGPTLLSGEPAAIPVLRELQTDASPEIRRMVQIGLERAAAIGEETP